MPRRSIGSTNIPKCIISRLVQCCRLFWYDATRAVTSSHPPTLFSLSHHLAFNSSHAGMISTSYDYLRFYLGHKNYAAVTIVIITNMKNGVRSFSFALFLFLSMNRVVQEKRNRRIEMSGEFAENGYRIIRNSWTCAGELACPPFTHVSFILSRDNRKNSATLWYQSTLVVCRLCGSNIEQLSSSL